MKANELKPGKAVVLDGNLYMCVKTDTVKPGKGGAFVQAKLKSIKGSGTVEKRFRSTDTVEGATLDRRAVEYLYSEGSSGVFMDGETYDQFNIENDILGNALDYIKPNESLDGMFYEGNCIAVQLPSAVNLEITEAEPGIKNATATNVLKDAIAETGVKVRVPPFINAGDKVRISTEDGSYLSRVTE